MNWTDRDTQDLRRIGETELGDPLTESDLDTIAMAANEMERLQARVVELENELHAANTRTLDALLPKLNPGWRERVATLEAEMRAVSAHTRELRMLLVGAVKFLQTVLAGTPDTSRLSCFVDKATDYLNRTSDPSDILRNVPK